MGIFTSFVENGEIRPSASYKRTTAESHFGDKNART